MDKALLPTAFAASKKMKKARLPFPSVEWVCRWALINAFTVAISPVISAVVPFTCGPSSWFFPCIKGTEEQNAAAGAIVTTMLWCTAPQASASAAALLLPRRLSRSRRSLALVALAATAAIHLLMARFIFVILAADPGYLFIRIYGFGFDFLYAVLDVVGFLGLLMGGEEEGD